MTAVKFQSEASWVEAAVGELQIAAAVAASGGSGALSICLAGGLTPERAYRAMASLSLKGVSADLWLGDERLVPASDPARNGAMIERTFAGSAWIPRPRLHLWPEAEAEEGAEAACARYEAELRASFGGGPAFDLVFLGLGADGHTASLFPRDPAVGAAASAEGAAGEERQGAAHLVRERLALPTRSPLPPYARMSLSFAALRSSRRRVFLVKGSDKLDAVAKLEAEDPGIPASRLAGPEAVILYLA